MTPSWLLWRKIARQVYTRLGAIFLGKTDFTDRKREDNQ